MTRVTRIGLGIAVILTYLFIGSPVLTRASTPLNPRVANVTDYAATVLWDTTASEPAAVTYGTSCASLTGTGGADGGNGNAHAVPLTSLTPGTTYYFAITSGGITYNNSGACWSFTTLPSATPPFPTLATGYVYTGSTCSIAVTNGAVTITDSRTGATSAVNEGPIDTNGGYALDFAPVAASDSSGYFAPQAGDTVTVTADSGLAQATVTTTWNGSDNPIAMPKLCLTSEPRITANTSSVVYTTGDIIAASGFGAKENVSLYFDSTSTPPLATATTGTLGGFSKSIGIPKAVIGPHTIIAVGQTTGDVAQATVLMTPSAVPAGTLTTSTAQKAITGYGFAAGETVTAHWNAKGGTQLASGTADSAGTVPLIITVPGVVAGTYHVYLVGSTSGGVGIATLTVQPSLTLSLKSGVRGATTTVTGHGYAANEGVVITWNCPTAGCSSGTALTTVTTNTYGTFNQPITVPSTAPPGVTAIGASGETSGTFVATNYTVLPLLTLSSKAGQQGTSITVSGSGYGANENVNILWNCPTATCTGATTLTTVPADANGNFTPVTVTIPSPVAPGRYLIAGLGATSSAFAAVPYTVSPTLTVTPHAVTVGSSATATGTGFTPGSTVTLHWGCSGLCSGAPVLGTTTADGNGGISIPFTVPAATYGVHTLSATDGSGYGFAPSSVSVGASLSINPASGAHGSTATVTGKGFGASETVTIKWDCAVSTCSSTTVLASPPTNSTGGFSATVTIPSSATASTTAHLIGGSGGTSGAFTTTKYTVTS